MFDVANLIHIILDILKVLKMLTFSEYYNGRQGEMGLADIDAFPSEDKLLLRALHVAVRSHNDKVMDFLAGLSKHDENIRRALSAYKDQRNSVNQKTPKQKNHDNSDVVLPNEADGGASF